jgi:HEAT repeat protein
MWSAARSLSLSKHPDAIAILIAALRATTDNRERYLVAQSLKLAAAAAPAIPELIPLLAEKDYLLPSTVASTLVSVGTAAVEPLLATLFVPPMQRRAEAAETLGRIGDLRAREPLQVACGDK